MLVTERNAFSRYVSPAFVGMATQFPLLYLPYQGVTRVKFLHAATVFFTIGLALAKEFFAQLGFHADYATIGLLGLALTTLLIFRGLLPILAVGVLAVLISLPDAMLVEWSLDRQLLQAAAITITLFPWIRRFFIDA